jgi:hypothetical protein
MGWDGMEGAHLDDDDDYSSSCAIVVPCILYPFACHVTDGMHPHVQCLGPVMWCLAMLLTWTWDR